MLGFGCSLVGWLRASHARMSPARTCPVVERSAVDCSILNIAQSCSHGYSGPLWLSMSRHVTALGCMTCGCQGDGRARDERSVAGWRRFVERDFNVQPCPLYTHLTLLAQLVPGLELLASTQYL